MQISPKAGIPVWRESAFICALADGERHLGHILKEDGWIAFDATHPNGEGGGIAQLGIFQDLTTAKEAVERAVSVGHETSVPRASAAGTSVQ